MYRASGIIVSATIDDFEALESKGILDVRVASTGDITSQFTVTVNCTDGLSRINAIEVSLEPKGESGNAADVSFTVEATRRATLLHSCQIALLNGLYEQVDSRMVNFTVRALEEDRGPQGGEGPEPSNDGAQETQSSDCTQVCTL